MAGAKDDSRKGVFEVLSFLDDELEPKKPAPKRVAPKKAAPKEEVNATAPEPKAVEPKVVEPKAVESKVAPKALEPKAVEPKAVEPKAVVSKVADVKAEVKAVVAPASKPAEPEKRKAQDGKMYTEADFIVFYGATVGRQAWEMAKPEEVSEINAKEPRTARAAAEPSVGPEIRLKLKLPNGQFEEIMVGPSKDAVAVLMKMIPLRKKYECLRQVSEDVELVKPDGKVLEYDESVEAQGLTDNTTLVVRDSQAVVEAVAEDSPSSEESTEKSSEKSSDDSSEKASEEKSEDEPVDILKDSVDDGEDAMRRYSERFAAEEENPDVPNSKKSSFPWAKKPDFKKKPVPVPQAKTEFPVFKEQKAAATPSSAWTQKGLNMTFGYAGSLDKKSLFARFDIRDEVCMMAGGFKHGEVVRDSRSSGEYLVIGVKREEGNPVPQLWFQPLNTTRRCAGTFPGATGADLRARLRHIEKPSSSAKFQKLTEASPADFDAAEDSDGEEMILCRECHLPVGACVYCAGEDKSNVLHGECMAQNMLKETMEEEEACQQGEKALKKSRRSKFDIGWKVEMIPRNLAPAKKLGCRILPQGMVCLTLEEELGTYDVAATVESMGAVNLEYLSVALKARVQDGREPWFSLDPKEPGNPNSMLLKKFEPEWLANTSAGEVLFQSDYHLKELSMGEHEQPVIGMKSAFDIGESNFEEWNAREWFVVRKAEVMLTDDNVMVPFVKMGVEAREQLIDKSGKLVDAKMSKQGHPLVKYADAFTHNFELIAERKSVIFHLRELAKASTLAKFMVEAGIEVDQAILNLAQESKAAHTEVPTIWNERLHAQVQMQNGVITNLDSANGNSVHGVYGGVQFGLEKFSLARPGAPQRSVLAGVATRPGLRAPLTARAARMAFAPSVLRPEARGVAPRAGVATRPGLRAPLTARAARMAFAPSVLRPEARGVAPRAGVATRPGLRAPLTARAARMAFAPSVLRPEARGVAPRGVDLNLGEFDLSEATRVEGTGGASWSDEDAHIAVGKAFFANIDGEESVFKPEDQQLLKAVFNSKLSDRREEGLRFVPPDPSVTYVQTLRKLVAEEQLARDSRKTHFLSQKFEIGNAGPVFPASWTSAIELSCGSGNALETLHPRPDYTAKSMLVQEMVKSTSPTFDKSTEDAIRFRIYRSANLEVRTTQEPEGKEVVGAVFSICAVKQEGKRGAAKDSESVVKVTEYVAAGQMQRRSYVVLETEAGNVVMTEQLSNGVVAWDENVKDLEERNALAKVIRTEAVSGVTLADMKIHLTGVSKEFASDVKPGGALSKSKRFSQAAFSRALGEKDEKKAKTGFVQPPNAPACNFGITVARTVARPQEFLQKSSHPLLRQGGKPPSSAPAPRSLNKGYNGATATTSRPLTSVPNMYTKPKPRC